MNISQRLRTCARHTGLDAVIELLNEAADEIDRRDTIAQAAQPAQVTWLLEAFDDAVSQELLSVSHVEYDSHEICKHFASKVRAILALQKNNFSHERVPMTYEQRQSAFLSAPTSSGGHRTAFMLGIQFAEAHHGITAAPTASDA